MSVSLGIGKIDLQLIVGQVEARNVGLPQKVYHGNATLLWGFKTLFSVRSTLYCMELILF